MPLEAIALQMQPSPFDICPRCGARPCTPFMRGQVQRSRLSLAGVLAFLCVRPWDYCAVICADCKKLVGWERPRDLMAQVEQFERHEEARRLALQWQRLDRD
jgi:hypothetical protein